MQEPTLTIEEASDQFPIPEITQEDTSAVADAAALAEDAPVDPVEESAKRFSQMLPSFKNMVNASPSKKGLARVINALVEFPLGKTTPRLLSDHERALFYLFQEIVAHKGVVMNDLMDKMRNERKEETNGQETN